MREDETVFRPIELALLVGRAQKARTVFGWVPKVGFKKLVHMMVNADMQTL